MSATLVVVAALAVGALTLLARVTHDRIARNERAWLLGRLDALVPPATHDNDLLADYTSIVAPAVFGTRTPVAVYRARKSGTPVAAVLLPVALDGYGGPIDLMVAVSYQGELLGVQVIAHHETPGLGDFFERSTWLDSFRGRSLGDPPQAAWTVRKEGGAFDQFTGATITPKAIIKTVRQTLEFYQGNRDRLFEPTTASH